MKSDNRFKIKGLLCESSFRHFLESNTSLTSLNQIIIFFERLSRETIILSAKYNKFTMSDKPLLQLETLYINYILFIKSIYKRHTSIFTRLFLYIQVT